MREGAAMQVVVHWKQRALTQHEAEHLFASLVQVKFDKLDLPVQEFRCCQHLNFPLTRTSLKHRNFPLTIKETTKNLIIFSVD